MQSSTHKSEVEQNLVKRLANLPYTNDNDVIHDGTYLCMEGFFVISFSTIQSSNYTFKS